MEKRMATALVQGKLSSDFFIRDRGTNIKQLLVLAIVTISIGTATMTINEKLAVTSVVFILFGCISWYLTLDVRNNLDLVKATEFQNAMFASALGMNSDFTFIIDKKDRNIFYIDRLFQDIFPEFSKKKERDLSSFFEDADISSDNRQAFISLFEQDRPQNMVFELKTGEALKKVAVSIAPIPRPQGFSIVQGRIL